MPISIKKDLGYSVIEKNEISSYELKYNEKGEESLAELFVKNSDTDCTLSFKGQEQMNLFVNFCREVVKGHEDFSETTGDTIYCGHCKKQQSFKLNDKIFSNGTKHTEAVCVVCDRWLKFVPQDKPLEEVVIPFGKYKGQKIVELPKEYLNFLLMNDLAKGNLRKQITEALEL